MTMGDTLDLENILEFHIAEPERHRRLLNTFSMLENIGAQKIHRFQRFGFTSEAVLRHAAEEARHALFFKSKTKLLGPCLDKGFSKELVLAPLASRAYLRRLDIEVNRYLKLNQSYKKLERIFLAYLLTTLLIELRANIIYPTYESLLRKVGSPISIRSIIIEERRHLQEIEEMLKKRLSADMQRTITHLQRVEESIYRNWLGKISHQRMS